MDLPKQTAEGRPVFKYIRPMISNEDEAHELAYFLIVICCHFKNVHARFFGMDGIANLREIINRFWLLKNALKDLVNCLYHFAVGRYGRAERESIPYFQVVEVEG